MDRKKAQSLIGKFVKVNDGVAGNYIATLKEVNAEPRKPWRGIVQINAVLDLPAFNHTTNQLQVLPYQDKQIVELEGSKLSADLEQVEPEPYEKSLLNSVQMVMTELDAELLVIEEKQKSLFSYLEEFGIQLDTVKFHQIEDNKEPDFIVYTFHHDGDQFILVDEQDERLDLEDCPFKISWKNKDQMVTGEYESNGSFLSDNGARYTPKEGAVFIIAKEQFDPYVILLNELEPTALLTLEKNLAYHQLTHEDLVECHNSLLTQLLDADSKETFNGVNFLTYSGSEGLVMVQHHYDRELHRYKNDKVYDRFEFTTEYGKRSIVTYTNEFSI